MDGALPAKGQRRRQKSGERVGKHGVGTRSKWSSASWGQNLVELALTLPPILLMLLAVMELGRAFLIYSEVSNAAREGARYGMVQPGDSAAIVEAARSRLAVVPADRISVAVGYDTEPLFGHRVIVTATHDLAMVTPLISDFIGPLYIEMVAARTIMGGE